MQQAIMDFFANKPSATDSPIQYFILCSQIPGVFNLGGDLALFVKLIREKKKAQLLAYATACIDLCYLNSVSMHLPLTTISLVEGTALGGGFESALSGNILLATKNAEMGFPEIRFNLFPGMGAYSFLARIAGTAAADKMISSGKIYSGKALYKKGLVHQLIDSKRSHEDAKQFIRHHRRSGNGHRALQLVRQRYHPLIYEELVDITEIWVNAALKLENKNLRMMERLVQAQLNKTSPEKYVKKRLVRTGQDRRFTSSSQSFPLTDWSGKEIVSDRRKNVDRRTLHKD